MATLREAFEHAPKNGESIAISEQSLREVEALYRRALVWVLTRVGFGFIVLARAREARDAKAKDLQDQD